MKYVANFTQWAYMMYAQFKQSEDYKNGNFRIVCGGNTTLLINLRTRTFNYAICHPTNIYNKDVGIGVAYARYCGVEIPTELVRTPLQKLKYGQTFVFDKFHIEHSVSKNYCQYIGQIPTDSEDICYCDRSGAIFRECGKTLVFLVK